MGRFKVFLSFFKNVLLLYVFTYGWVCKISKVSRFANNLQDMMYRIEYIREGKLFTLSYSYFSSLLPVIVSHAIKSALINLNKLRQLVKS